MLEIIKENKLWLKECLWIVFLDLCSSIVLLVPLLLSVAFLTLIERKILGAVQKRKGPNVVGFWGILQPLADGLKLVVKESIIPSAANKYIYILAPVFFLSFSFINWVVIPFSRHAVYSHINLAILYVLSVSSISVYSIIFAGWASNSRYALLGGLRAAAQMISYEVSMMLILLSVLVEVGSFDLTSVVLSQKSVYFCIPMFPIFLLFIISVLAETSRAPFDLPEAEGELVAGYNVEYSGFGFAAFFIAEYLNIIFVSSLIVLIFFGGWLDFPISLMQVQCYFFWVLAPIMLGDSPDYEAYAMHSFEGTKHNGAYLFVVKMLIVMYFIVWVRAALPRYRYDQLMNIGWKFILPLSLCFFIVVLLI